MILLSNTTQFIQVTDLLIFVHAKFELGRCPENWWWCSKKPFDKKIKTGLNTEKMKSRARVLTQDAHNGLDRVTHALLPTLWYGKIEYALTGLPTSLDGRACLPNKKNLAHTY